MGLLVQLIVLGAAALVANAGYSRNAKTDKSRHCDEWCEYPLESRSYRCCDEVPPSMTTMETVTPVSPRDDCKDISPNCAANTLRCDTSTYIQERCRKTCGLCGKDCGQVKPPQNGRVIENGTMYGDTIKFECDEGYDLDGSTDAECLNTGKWSAEVPQCQRKDCGQVKPPQNGRVIENGTKYGDTIEFECDERYTLHGSTDAECLSTGKWSAEVPQCRETPSIPVCGSVKPPQNGRVIENGTMYRDTIKFECDEGYDLDGSTDAQCLITGKWSNKVPQCHRKDCGQVKPPQNGRVIENGTKYGDTIEFECDEGYTLHGSTDAECLSTGKWSAEVPQCRETPFECPECPEDRRMPGNCDNWIGINITTPAPPTRCYNNGDCPSGLLCCYDACLGQTCKNPIPVIDIRSPKPASIPASSVRSTHV